MTTTADRLTLLVEWVNDDFWSGDDGPAHQLTSEVQSRLRRFVESFDGSAAAGYVRVEPFGAGAGVLPPDLLLPKLSMLHMALIELLRSGFPEPGYPPSEWKEVSAFPSIQFGLAPPSKRKKKGGAYRLVVSGKPFDLVRFLVIHLLTTAGGESVLASCPAPKAFSSSERCGKFLVTVGQGRPRKFCSDACRIRDHSRDIDNTLRRKNKEKDK